MSKTGSHIKFLMLIFVLLSSTNIDAQERTLYFKSYSVEDGLSQNTIYSIVQDKKDFIWLATQSGLNRFDGYTFKSWNHEQDNPNSLISGFINSLAIDEFNNIWIATITGINCFIQEKNIFLYFDKSKNKLSNNYVNDIFIDSKGYLWAGTQNGLNRSKNTLKKIPNDTSLQFIRFISDTSSKSLSSNNINCIYEDANNIIWLGTQNGLNKLSRETNEFEHYFFTANKIYHKENDINSIIQLQANIYWIATKQGLFELNTNNKKFKTISNLPFFIENKISGSFTKMFKEPNGDLWIGTKDNGLILYDIKRKEFLLYKKNSGKKHSLNSNYITSVYVDRSSAIFVGNRLGLNISKTNTGFFTTYNYLKNSSIILKDVTAITKQNRDSVWIGTFSGGLELFNPVKNTFKHFDFQRKFISNSSEAIYSILPENSNQIWLGTLKNGLYLYNHKNNTYKHYAYSEKKNSISNNGVFSLTKQDDSTLWIGTWGAGIDRLNLKTGIFKNFCLNKNKQDKDKVLVSNIQLYNNNLWIATWGKGVFQLNTKTFKITHYQNTPANKKSISSNYILISHIDNTGFLWFGTASGLIKFNPKTKEFTHFGKNIGFEDEFINSIEEDEHNNLWLSTNKGIIKFNISKETAINFDIRDGLQDSEFNSRANTKLPDGRIIFGGIYGFNIFYPDSIKQSIYKPNIVITGLQLFYKDVVSGKKYRRYRYFNF